MENENQTILIIDDDFFFARYLARIIQENIQIKVEIKVDPHEAIKYLNDNIPALIILDMMLPKMDGLTFLRNLRSNDATQNVPVIVCSALGNQQTVGESVKLNIAGYIVKPTNQTIVIDKVTNALSMLSKENPSE
ncbi:MAG: response regulator [Candidatus Kapabacteria bacterium]|nr:response regulator [Candidatus Kapabacteria bacterium]